MSNSEEAADFPEEKRWEIASKSLSARQQVGEHDADVVVADLLVQFEEDGLQAGGAVDLGGGRDPLAHVLRHPAEDRRRLLGADEIGEVAR